MGKKCLRISESAIYRTISNELVVIQLETGSFFYFSPETEPLLNTLKKTRRIAEICESGSDEEATYLRKFFDFLLENKIVSEGPEEEAAPMDTDQLPRPTFLRKGEKTLDEMTFLCP